MTELNATLEYGNNLAGENVQLVGALSCTCPDCGTVCDYSVNEKYTGVLVGVNDKSISHCHECNKQFTVVLGIDTKLLMLVDLDNIKTGM